MRWPSSIRTLLDQFSLGGLPACCCGCTATFSCADSGCGAVTVTIRDPAPSGAPVATGTVAPGGSLSLPIPAAGTYDVTFSGGTCTAPNTQALDLACGGSDAAPCCVCDGDLCIIDCDTGLPIGGASVSFPGGGCTADATGCCTFVTGCSRTLDVTASAPGYRTYTGTVTIACDATDTICLVPVAGDWQLTVWGDACCQTSWTGYVFRLSDGQSCTADATGVCTFLLVAGATYTYTATKDRWATLTGSFLAGDPSLAAGLVLYPAPAPGYHCGTLGGTFVTGQTVPIEDPLPDTLFATDSRWGGATMNWDDASQQWVGNLSVQDPATCGCPGSPVTITYSIGTVQAGTAGYCQGPSLSFPQCNYYFLDQLVSDVCACDQGTPPDAGGYQLGAPSGTCGWAEFLGPLAVASTAVPYSFSGVVAPPDDCNAPGARMVCFMNMYPGGVTLTITE